jgi:AraC family transcriptional regulator
MPPYPLHTAEHHVVDSLNQSHATLLSSVALGNQFKLAHWSNRETKTSYVKPEHHTLSLYMRGGQQTRRLIGDQQQVGGGPGKLCIMPEGHESHWLIGEQFSFIHLYFTQQQLQACAERIWDKEVSQLRLDEHTFLDDPQIAQLIEHWIAPINWHDTSERLGLEQASQLLITHLVRHYSTQQFAQPVLKGGLSPVQWRHCREYIEANLSEALGLGELAAITGLSEFHFAHLFKRSSGLSPHQYVLKQRIEAACRLLRDTDKSLAQISYELGFSSQAHFSSRFKQRLSLSPSQYRRQSD